MYTSSGRSDSGPGVHTRRGMVYFKLTSTGCVSEISVRSGYSSGSNVAAGRGSAITWSFKHRQTTHTKQMSVWERKHDKALFVLATQNTPLSGLQ